MANRFIKIERRRLMLNLPVWAYEEIKRRSISENVPMTNIIIELLKINLIN